MLINWLWTLVAVVGDHYLKMLFSAGFKNVTLVIMDWIRIGLVIVFSVLYILYIYIVYAQQVYIKSVRRTFKKKYTVSHSVQSVDHNDL